MATTQSRAFRRQVVKKKAPAVTTPFFLETTDVNEDGEEYVVRRDDFVATKPTDERLFLFIGGATGDGLEDETGSEAGAILSLLRDVLPGGQYKVLIGRLRDPDDEVDMEMLAEVIEFLVEEWADFPTLQPSGSSTSSAGTGARSTGRARGKGSIPSN